jgi:hypothetical protein
MAQEDVSVLWCCENHIWNTGVGGNSAQMNTMSTQNWIRHWREVLFYPFWWYHGGGAAEGNQERFVDYLTFWEAVGQGSWCWAGVSQTNMQ